MADCFLHNPRCGKSRAALELVRARDPGLTVIEYLRTPPSVDELRRLCGQLGVRPVDVVRAHEPLLGDLGLSVADERGDEAWLAILAAHPLLIERPILSRGGRAVIGRPPERVLELFDQ